MVYQSYVTEVNNEHVIMGNDALFKCVTPSFVSDFVTVSSWVTEHGRQFYKSAAENYGSRWLGQE